MTVVDSVLTNWNIFPDSYAFYDGSGLSRYNLFSPKQIVTVLKKMRRHEDWFLWKDLFPTSGKDGTLKYRLLGTPLEGNIFAKTGTMSNVRCLSGYCVLPAGHELVFSIMVNGHLLKTRQIDKVVDKILSIISRIYFN